MNTLDQGSLPAGPGDTKDVLSCWVAAPLLLWKLCIAEKALFNWYCALHCKQAPAGLCINCFVIDSIGHAVVLGLMWASGCDVCQVHLYDRQFCWRPGGNEVALSCWSFLFLTLQVLYLCLELLMLGWIERRERAFGYTWIESLPSGVCQLTSVLFLCMLEGWRSVTFFGSVLLCFPRFPWEGVAAGFHGLNSLGGSNLTSAGNGRDQPLWQNVASKGLRLSLSSWIDIRQESFLVVR